MKNNSKLDPETLLSPVHHQQHQPEEKSNSGPGRLKSENEAEHQRQLRKRFAMEHLDVAAQERTFDGAYTRTALNSLVTGIFIYRIFYAQFEGIALTLVVFGILLSLIAGYRRISVRKWRIERQQLIERLRGDEEVDLGGAVSGKPGDEELVRARSASPTSQHRVSYPVAQIRTGKQLFHVRHHTESQESLHSFEEALPSYQHPDGFKVFIAQEAGERPLPAEYFAWRDMQSAQVDGEDGDDQAGKKQDETHKSVETKNQGENTKLEETQKQDSLENLMETKEPERGRGVKRKRSQMLAKLLGEGKEGETTDVIEMQTVRSRTKSRSKSVVRKIRGAGLDMVQQTLFTTSGAVVLWASIITTAAELAILAQILSLGQQPNQKS